MAKSGRPSATTSKRRLSTCRRSRSCTHVFWETRTPASLSATLQWKPTAPALAQAPRKATRVKWLATGANCRRQGKMAPKATCQSWNLGTHRRDGTPVAAHCRYRPIRGRRYQLLGGVSDIHFGPPNGTRQCFATMTTSSGLQSLGDGAAPQGECQPSWPNMPGDRRTAWPHFVGHWDVQHLFEAPSDSCVVTHREMETLFRGTTRRR